MNETTTDVVPVRDAATVIVLRERAGVPHVLMGQRGAGRLTLMQEQMGLVQQIQHVSA